MERFDRNNQPHKEGIVRLIEYLRTSWHATVKDSGYETYTEKEQRQVRKSGSTDRYNADLVLWFERAHSNCAVKNCELKTESPEYHNFPITLSDHKENLRVSLAINLDLAGPTALVRPRVFYVFQTLNGDWYACWPHEVQFDYVVLPKHPGWWAEKEELCKEFGKDRVRTCKYKRNDQGEGDAFGVISKNAPYLQPLEDFLAQLTEHGTPIVAVENTTGTRFGLRVLRPFDEQDLYYDELLKPNGPSDYALMGFDPIVVAFVRGPTPRSVSPSIASTEVPFTPGEWERLIDEAHILGEEYSRLLDEAKTRSRSRQR